MKEVPLTELAAVIRSKNAGPYELTLDILFKQEEDYLFLKEQQLLYQGTVCSTLRDRRGQDHQSGLF